MLTARRFSGQSSHDAKAIAVTDLPKGIADYFEQARVALTIARADDPEHKLFEVNEQFCLMTGYERSKVLFANCRFLQKDLRDQPGVDALRNFLKDPSKNRVRAHLINFRVDGSPFVNLLTMTRLRGQGGTPRYILGSQFDVTSAAPEQLVRYDASLASMLERQQTSREQREILIGSVQSLAEAAATIAQAHLVMEEADKSGLLT